MSQLTYGGLEKVLRSLGFSVRTLADDARGYQHETGARLVLPPLPERDGVQPRHLLAVRTLLQAYGIPEPPELAHPTQRAG